MQGPPLVQGTTFRDVFDSATVGDEALRRHLAFELLGVELGETPFLGDVDLLAAGELELGPAQGFDHMLLVLQLGADGHDDLADVHPGHGALRLPEGATHAGLEAVGARARQHLVDADDVEGVQAHADVEAILAAALHHVLVGADTGGLQGLRRQLLVLIRHHVAAERELVHLRLLPTQVEDADFRVGDPAAEARLGVRLVLTVPVTASRATTHGDGRRLRSASPRPATKWSPGRNLLPTEPCGDHRVRGGLEDR